MRQWIGITSKILVIGIGALILLISMARAGWETRANGDTEAVAGNNLVDFTAVFDDGTTAVGNYKLPASGILPDNMVYGIKTIRNQLWLLFSRGPAKTKMALLLADKSASETKELIEEGKINAAIDAGNEAIDKLEYADTLVNQTKTTDVQNKQVHYQIFWAGYAYEEVFKKIEGTFDLDTTKYANLINRVNDWNKKQEENRYNWEN
jgi:hypothetical protein